MTVIIFLFLIGVYNLALHRLVPHRVHIIFAVLSSIVLVAWINISQNISLDDVALGVSSLWPGIFYGLIIGLLIVICVLAAGSFTPTRRFFRDSRNASVSLGTIVYRAVIHIPFGTILLEEIIFRGILLALLLEVLPVIWACILNALIFGVWHVLPALTHAESAPWVSGRRLGRSMLLGGTLLFTSVAGFLFCLLRIWTDSTYAVMVVHYAANSSSLIASWLAHRLR